MASKKKPAKKKPAKKPAKKAAAKKAAKKATRAATRRQPAKKKIARARAGTDTTERSLPAAIPKSQQFVRDQLSKPGVGGRSRSARPIDSNELSRRIDRLDVSPRVDRRKYLEAVNRIRPAAAVPLKDLPEEVRASLQALEPPVQSRHGAKLSLAYFPAPAVTSPCADMFGYMSSAATRSQTRLPFNPVNQGLLNQLGNLMADPGRETSPDSVLPAGFTYLGQFVDHDVTLDVSSSLDVSTDANTIHNMRTPVLDLDSVYGGGPVLAPFLYQFPTSGNPTAIRLQLGTNQATGPGGPAGSSGSPASMVAKTDFDVPRMPTPAQTAVIGDPRNDENLIVVQLHQTMLRFHNEVIDLLEVAAFTGDLFVEAQRIVRHHYQWAVVHDFLERICGGAVVSAALSGVSAPVGSSFRMPVEFAVAAYRFGHSMVRDRYWVNFNFPSAGLGDVFAFNRPPNLPVLSSWVVDFNAFLETGNAVPVFNRARKIDSVLANGLESLPGFAGLMAVLATRNLRRGLALGLPSGQGMANELGVPAMTEAQLTQGLPPDEIGVLQANGKRLLKKTPLWYYVLREAAVLENGDRLGPVGAKIVADTFVRMLKRDGQSFLRVPGGFTPFLPSATPGDFTFADLAAFAGVTEP